MRVLVCGGREFDDEPLLYMMLDKFHNNRTITCLIHGAARGADQLGARWAKSRGIPIEAYPANWEAYGKAAGLIRNEQMLEFGKPDVVIAFQGGNGTAHMVRVSKQAGKEVHEIEEVSMGKKRLP